MNTTKTLLLAAGSAFVAGTFGLGFGMAFGPPPETVTKVQGVEVPGETVEVVKTKEVTPEACRTAIAAAEDLGETTSRTFEDMAEWPLLVPRAFEAGLLQDAQEADEVLAEMDDLTQRHEKSLGEVEGLVEAFNVAKAGC